MSVTIDITISEDLVSDHDASDTHESGEADVPEPGSLQSWAEAAYLGNTPAVASMLITTAEEIQQLNKQYRDIVRFGDFQTALDISKSGV